MFLSQRHLRQEEKHHKKLFSHTSLKPPCDSNIPAGSERKISLELGNIWAAGGHITLRKSGNMGKSMTRPSLTIALASLFAVNFVMGGQQSMATSGPWSGIIINSGCTADEAFAEADKCTDNAPGAKLVLYDDTTRQIFSLDETEDLPRRI